MAGPPAIQSQAPHSSTVLGTRASDWNNGPSMGSVPILLFRLGLPSELSVVGDKATAAFGARRPWSRTQASNDSVRLPPAESPAHKNGRGRRGAAGSVVQHPAVGGAAVFDAGQARVFRHQAIVDGQHAALAISENLAVSRLWLFGLPMA